jgi:predicted methyltransferase
MFSIQRHFAQRLLVTATVFLALGMLADAADKTQRKPETPNAAKTDQAKERAKALRRLFTHLGLGKGSAVADIGAGGGQDTWVFADLVGPNGTVFAQEIAEGKVGSLKNEAAKRKLSQVRAVLGRTDDPALPAASVNMAYLHYVYHHFSRPREMLRGIWRSLKPGGYLVVVDKERGTLREWVPESVRAEKHHWTAETTVVRHAREEGFAFVECAEDHWHSQDEFVLVFRRPEGVNEPGHDPDPFLALPLEPSVPLFRPVGRPYQRPVFVALGPSRNLILPIQKASSSPGVEIILEEWATQKDERPSLPAQVSLPAVLTDKGDPHLGAEPVDVVFFLDSYHLLFHGRTLLAKLRETLSPTGCVYVLDRQATTPVSRREASHRRRIAKETVLQEMSQAGFFLWFTGPQPAADRFLLVFGKRPEAEISPQVDPFVGGPTVSGPPGDWLKQNLWRLRGLKTADGRVAPLASSDREGTVEAVASDASGKETSRLQKSKLVLSFDKEGERYSLSDFRSTDQPP